MSLIKAAKSALTRAGWPRPMVGGYPIPWVSPPEDLSTMSPARMDACATGAICAVCGGDYEDGEEAFAFVHSVEKPEVGPDESLAVQAMDNAIMHERCARLAMKVCPRLSDSRAKGHLYMIRTRGNVAKARRDKKTGRLHAVVDAELIEEVIDLATF